ncbi:hypothetical protein TNCV_673341 [Trichonephila clavipes]|uniref:Uncharacterized protein n=1 Tax=Trichonephila clavipes TaxID=2585209 RepID=A0A8X6WDU8_TRICX|nr:hypothetical protein TNCV_673341 [Trichonephila clavipes]
MEFPENTNQDAYTAAYTEFHKPWESNMNTLVTQLNSCRTSDECFIVIRNTVDSKLRELPFNIEETQVAALRNLSDILDEARFFTHQKKWEIAEQNKPLKAQINAWRIHNKPLKAPFQVVINRKRRKSSGDNQSNTYSNAKKRTDMAPTQNRHSQLPSEDNMDHSAQESTSTENGHSDGAAPQEKKNHVPPIIIDNVTNQAVLLKHLQNLTKLKLEAKLICTKLRNYPRTAYAYHRIRKCIHESSLEVNTYMLPEDTLRKGLWKAHRPKAKKLSVRRRIFWVAPKSQKIKWKRRKKTTMALSSLTRSSTTPLRLLKSTSGSGEPRMPHNANSRITAPPKTPPKPHPQLNPAAISNQPTTSLINSITRHYRWTEDSQSVNLIQRIVVARSFADQF